MYLHNLEGGEVAEVTFWQEGEVVIIQAQFPDIWQVGVIGYSPRYILNSVWWKGSTVINKHQISVQPVAKQRSNLNHCQGSIF